MLYMLAGVVPVKDVYGTPDGQWVRGTGEFDIPIAGLSDGQGLRLVHWTVQLGRNSVANDGEGDNLAFAVDNFRLVNYGDVMRTARIHRAVGVVRAAAGSN
ncbi:MAG: hypothetical protein ACRDQ7_08840, partial [Haloechinothrix sp.]